LKNLEIENSPHRKNKGKMPIIQNEINTTMEANERIKNQFFQILLFSVPRTKIPATIMPIKNAIRIATGWTSGREITTRSGAISTNTAPIPIRSSTMIIPITDNRVISLLPFWFRVQNNDWNMLDTAITTACIVNPW
jgi:hypothetical protein